MMEGHDSMIHSNAMTVWHYKLRWIQITIKQLRDSVTTLLLA